jgi:CDP-glycerol glycerophosphotransferase
MKNQFASNKYKNILCYDAICDIYPALSLFDVLITDYSSIYFDYLLLNRPIIFFPYDYESYIAKDKELLFDYLQITPGPVCKSQDEVEKALLEIDTYEFAKKRKEISELVFDYHDSDASTRLWKILAPTFTNND